MKFEKGRPKSGGRTKGTPNKKRVPKIRDYLAEQGFNPAAEVLRLMLALEPFE